MSKILIAILFIGLLSLNIGTIIYSKNQSSNFKEKESQLREEIELHFLHPCLFFLFIITSHTHKVFKSI